MDPDLKRLQDELTSATVGLSPEQMNWHPAGKWSVAEILEHLYLTYTGTIKGISRMLESGRPQASVPKMTQRAQAFVVVTLGYLPAGRESPAAVRPKGVFAGDVLQDFQSKIEEMDRMLATCQTRFGNRTKVLDHPLLGPFSISQWRKFHLVHGRHHVKQIYRLRSSQLQSQ